MGETTLWAHAAADDSPPVHTIHRQRTKLSACDRPGCMGFPAGEAWQERKAVCSHTGRLRENEKGPPGHRKVRGRPPCSLTWAVRWMGVCSLEAKTILSLFKTAATEKPNALALRVESSGNSWSCWTYKQSEHSPSSVPQCRYVNAPSASCRKSLGECFGVDRPGPSAHPYSESTSTT